MAAKAFSAARLHTWIVRLDELLFWTSIEYVPVRLEISYRTGDTFEQQHTNYGCCCPRFIPRISRLTPVSSETPVVADGNTVPA